MKTVSQIEETMSLLEDNIDGYEMALMHLTAAIECMPHTCSIRSQLVHRRRAIADRIEELGSEHGQLEEELDAADEAAVH